MKHSWSREWDEPVEQCIIRFLAHWHTLQNTKTKKEHNCSSIVNDRYFYCFFCLLGKKSVNRNSRTFTIKTNHLNNIKNSILYAWGTAKYLFTLLFMHAGLYFPWYSDHCELYNQFDQSLRVFAFCRA